jgi:hypothetical protein
VIVGVASCPQPPLLLPGRTGCPVAEVERLRAACLAAIAELLAVQPESLVVIGGVAAAEAARLTAAEAGSQDEPVSIRIGRYLLAEAGCTVPVRPVSIRTDATTEECLATGRQLAAEACEQVPGNRIGLLVMADGSARRGLKAPGYLDERAGPFDERIAAALTAGKPAGLAGLEEGLAAELMVAGRAAWQVLAGATAGATFTATTHYLDDPFGVYYPVVSWS